MRLRLRMAGSRAISGMVVDHFRVKAYATSGGGVSTLFVGDPASSGSPDQVSLFACGTGLFGLGKRAPRTPLPSRSPSSDSDREQRGIVAEHAAGELAHAMDDRIDHAARGVGAERADRFDESIVAEIGAVGPFGFGDAVGEEHEPIAGSQCDRVLSIARVGIDA